MKIIHCADLHLDSKMTANLNSEKAKERKQELLHTFKRMVAYADHQDIHAILIAGDLFDTKNITKTTQNVVLGEIENHPDITFYYLKGNHDLDNFLSNADEIPDNLKMFEDQWSYYEAGKDIVIAGIELKAENVANAYASLVLDTEKINVVMLHGQESETGSKDKVETINLRALQNKGIDYLALGHVHAYKEASLDARGRYCYPGCLEGRGFDECGPHGFVVIDIDEKMKTVKSELIPFATRTLYTIPVDVTGCMKSVDMVVRIREELDKQIYGDSSLIKFVLTGELDVECEKNIDYIRQEFEPEFYFVKVYDETKLHVDIEQYALDVSLKGEFVRIVKETADLTEDEKNTIIRYGLHILEGEEEVE